MPSKGPKQLYFSSFLCFLFQVKMHEANKLKLKDATSLKAERCYKDATKPAFGDDFFFFFFFFC